MLNAATAWMSIFAYILTHKIFDGVLFTIKDPLWFPVYRREVYVWIWGALLLGAPNGNGTVAKIFSIKPMVFFGKISFSAYLWHLGVMKFVGQYQGFTQETRRLELTLLTFIGTFFVSSLSYYSIERPLYMWVFRAKQEKLITPLSRGLRK